MLTAVVVIDLYRQKPTKKSKWFKELQCKHFSMIGEWEWCKGFF
jgi:hypothetical protein